jgi:hypothetical protein
VADIITRPTVGPTKSSTAKSDALDGAISNPDYLCPPPDQTEYTTYLTTWIYPLYAFDNMNVSAAVSDDCYMGPLPYSDASIDFGSSDGSWSQQRWFKSDGPYDSDATIGFASSDGSWLQARWFKSDGPYDSDASINFAATDGLLENKLVTAEAPDEALQLDCTINDTCSMELL